MNNGQACVAQTRILVSERRHDEVVDALADMMSGLQVGDPADEATDVGPLVAQRQQARVQDYIRSGVKEGARMVLGGEDAPHDHGWYVRPTLFADATNDMRIAREEIFGPVLSVLTYRDEARRGPDRQRQRLRSGRIGVDRRHRARPRGRRERAGRHLRHQHVHARHRQSRSAVSSNRASAASSARRACTSMSSCSR